MIRTMFKKSALVAAMIALTSPAWVHGQEAVQEPFSNTITVVKEGDTKDTLIPAGTSSNLISTKTLVKESLAASTDDVSSEDLVKGADTSQLKSSNRLIKTNHTGALTDKERVKLEKEQAKAAEKARKEAEKAEKARKLAEEKAAKEKAKAEAKAAKEKAKAEAKAAKEAEKARKKAEKEAQKHGKTLEPTPLVEEKPKKPAGAFEEEHLVPLDEFLANLPYRYTSNQWKTKYTIWIPRVSLQDGKLVMDPYAQAEPLNLSYVERPVIIKDQDGQETKSAKTERFVDTNAFRLLVDGMTLPQKQVLQNPVAWAFDPMTTEAHPTLMHKGGTNIMSPSWFKLDSNGLEVSPRVNTEYVRTYRDKGYQVWPLITNQFSPSFTASILKKNDTGLWATYAQQLVIYALAYGFEGYNFDFENINLSDKDRLTQFVTYLSDYLHKYNIYTSIDVTGYSTSENWSMVYDRPALSQAVDYVVLMAYDETGHSSTTAGPVASYPWVRKHTEKMVTEVPPNKLVLGIPFYTRVWTETYGRAKSKTLTIQDSRNYLKAYGNHIQWDDNLKSYTLVIPSSGLAKTDATVPVSVEHPSGSVQKIWFEDEKSLDYKLQLVNELHLAGFAAWRKGFEDTSINDLIANYPLYTPEKVGGVTNISQASQTIDQAKTAEKAKTDKETTKVAQKLLKTKSN